MDVHSTKILFLVVLAAWGILLPSVSSQGISSQGPAVTSTPARIQPDQVLIQDNKLTFATATDSLQIEHTLPGRTLPFDVGYRLSEDRLEPSVRITLPSEATAAALRGGTLQVQYHLTFNTDVSSTYADPAIPLRSGQYLYLPRFYCTIQIGADTYTAAGQLQERSLVSPTEVQFRVGLPLTDTDVDEFGQEVTRDLPLAQGTIITCTDPIVPNSTALHWPGVFYWSNSSSNEFYAQWEKTGLNMTTKTEISYTSGTWRWTESDYSTVKDVGIICHSDQGGNPVAQVINTSTGATINMTDLGYGGTISSQYCDVLFWKDSADAIIAYENGLGDNALQVRAYTYPSGLGSAQTVNFTAPANVNDRLEWFSIKQRPGANEAAIGWHDLGGTNDSIGFILWDKTNGKLFNWTSNASFVPYVGNGNRFDLAWTADGSKLFIFLANVTATTSATVYFFVYDRALNAMSNAYTVGTGGVIDDARLCTLRGRTDAVIYIAQSYPGGGGSVNVGVLLANGSVEAGGPSADTATERDIGELNLNIQCFQEPDADGDMILTFVDDGALGLDYVLYDPDTKNWSVSALTSANTSGSFASDDIEMTALTPCPAQSDCAMFATVDALSDVYTGVYWNGTVFSITHALAAENSTTGSGRNPFSFLFRNATVTAEPSGVAPDFNGLNYSFPFNDTLYGAPQPRVNWSYDWQGRANYSWQYSNLGESGGIVTMANGAPLNGTVADNRSVLLSGNPATSYALLYLGRYFNLKPLNWTIECWVRGGYGTANDSTWQRDRSIWGQINNGGPELYWAYSNQNRNFTFRWRDSNGVQLVNLSGRTTNDPNLNSSWVHIALTSNTGEAGTGWVTMVLNGTNDSHYNFGRPLVANDFGGSATAFQFGFTNNPGPGQEIPNLYFDECRIWNTTRSASNISSLMFSAPERIASNGTESGSNTTANESAGRTAIETGITTSELVSPTIDTDMVVYVVTQGGTHSVGTYDKLASAGSKRWAFNYLAGSDAQQNLTNLTPSLYFWEYGGLTTAQIQTQVSRFINTTN